MEYLDAKEKFISTWGSLGSLWGINKAMAQIQALLFISTKPLSMEDIMEDLKISRGNTSMNLRQLMDWGIVTKVLVSGERKEFFTTEKDVQELAKIVAKERSRREIKPVIKVLEEVSTIKDDGTEKTKELIKQTKALKAITNDLDTLMNKLVDQKQNWLTKSVFKLMK
ncbi:ArsR family transcriptional regulator [Winogradskyella echinorum]|uniref:HTH-type transcriptional regulator n=1 Tax=Winogradskyella echinorum TaxID=538189 RepID=A0ABR6Y4G0_9FLAO|nr:ArsR family transcriptional regulator [Winogradskyella echinorum]MBC3847590.1 ArsR family transcriptional regulator [Winogradskyella echinorum]MBC5751938.1 ArsR family transcriptional regulator [Winogradskyella echinorum]